MISRCAKFVGRVTTALLFVAVVPVAMRAQEAPSAAEGPIEYQRIFVPANRPKEWPQAGFEFAPQIELAEFERLVREFSRTQNQVDDSIPIRGLTYRARLDGDTLAGTVNISLPPERESSHGFVALDRSNLLYSNDDERLLEAPDVLVGGFQKEHGAYLREPLEAIQLDWSYQAEVLSANELELHLELLFSPRTDFYLELPAGWDVELEEGVLLQKPDEEETAETRVWHLAPQWEGKLSFHLVSSEGGSGAPLVTATQLSSYEVRTNVCHVSTQYALYSQPRGPLDLTLPETFVLSRVLLNGQELSEPDVHEGEDGSRQLRIPQAAFPPGQTATLTMEGVATLELGDYSRIDLPIIFATSQPTESHVVAVELEQGISLSYSVLKNAQQVTFVPHNSLGRSNLRFRLYDSAAKIGLQLFRPQAETAWTIVNRVTVNDLLMESDCVITIGQGRRTSETVELPLAEGWHANELVLPESETEAVVRWEETSRDGRRVLRMDNAAGLPRVRFTLRRTRDNDFGNLRLADFRPFDFSLGAENAEWIAVKPDAGFDLQLEPEGQVARVAIENLPQEIAELFGNEWKTPAFAIQGRADLQHLVRVSRKRATYDAQIDIQTALRESSYQEHASIRLSGTGLLPETLFVWSTRPWSSEVQWTTPDLVPIGWTAVTTSANEPGNEREPYYIYELRPPAENSFPLVLEGTFPETNSSYEIPLLLAVPSAESQAGTLSLRVPDTCQVTASPSLLRKVYSSQAALPARASLQQFEYRPFEIRRLAESRHELLACDWTDRLVLPEIFSPEARHAVRIENDGALRYVSSWKMVVKSEADAVFELPPGAQVETVQWDGQPWYRWRHLSAAGPGAGPGAANTVSIHLPDSSTAALLEISYQRRPGPLGLVRRVEAEFAQSQFPTSSQFATFALGSRLQQMRLPQVHWAELGKRLRHALWTGLFQAITDTSPANAESIQQQEEAAALSTGTFPQRGVWVVHLGLLLPVSIGTLLLGVAIGWRFFPRRPRWVLAGVLAVVAVAVWLPEVLAPLSSALFLGLILGGIGGFLLIPSTVTETPRSSASTVTVVGLLLVAMITGTVGEINGVLAADEVSAPVLYPVLIPIDGERKPIGQAYLPQPLYERLVAASRKSSRQLPGYVVEGMRFEVAVQEASTSITTHIDVITTQANQAVRLPFDPQLGAGLTTALLNGGILPSPFDADDAELDLTFREAGRHVVEIQSSLPLEESTDEPQRLHIETPPHVNISVTLTDSLQMGDPTIHLAGRSLSIEPSNIRQTIPLGTGNGFDIEWSSPASRQQFEFQELDLLEYREDEVRLRVRLKRMAEERPTGPILLEVDSRLLLVPQQGTSWKVEAKSSEEAAATRLFTISAAAEDALPEEIELSFTLDGAQQVGQLRFPSVRVINGNLQRRWVAVAAADQLQVQSQARSRVNVRSQEEFLREWEDPIPDFRFAVASADTEPLDWLISTRPITTRGIADFKHRLLLDEDGYQFETRVQIETYSGDPSQYVVQLMPEAQVDSVQYLVDGLPRPAQWHYDAATGELGIQLLNSVNGLQDLTIRGQAWHVAQSPDLILDPIEIRGVVTQSCQVQLFRDHSVLVRTLPGNNLLPMQEESLEGLEYDMVPVGQWEVPEPAEPVRWQVLPNDILITGDLLTVARRVDGTWRIDLSGKLDVRSGIVEKMQWLVPNGITLDPHSFEDFTVSSRLLPDGSAWVYDVTPTMPLGNSISFDWTGTLETTPGQRTQFSSIQLIGQPRVGQFVAVPNQVDNQEVLWISQMLSPTAVTGRWLNAHTPPGHQLLRATRPDFTCEMLQRSNRQGEPQIDALESTLLVDGQGNVFGVTRAAILPQGSHEIELTCPPEVEILAASVDFQGQARLDSQEAAAARIPLQSNSLPQVVEFAFRTKLEAEEGQGAYRLHRPSLGYSQNTQELLRVALPPGMTLRDLPVSAPSAWNQGQVEAAFRLKEAPRDSLSGLKAAEIERWNVLRMDQALTALHRFQELLRARGDSTETAQATIAAVLGDKAAQMETWPVSGRDRNLESLMTAAEMGSVNFQYFTQDASAVPLRLHASRASVGSLGPPGVVTLLCLLAAGLLFGKLPILRRWGLEARQWVMRYPQVCGILVGLFWWLFLPPHGIGLLLILAVVWASTPSLPRLLGGRG